MNRLLLSSVGRDLALLCAAVVLGMIAYWPTIKNDAYGYDEADYMYAARQGLWANYWDVGSVAWVTFLRYGVDHLRGERSARELSELIRGAQDIGFYRHYHAPLYFYGLSAARQVFGDRERFVRATSFAWLFATVLLAYAACVQLGSACGWAPHHAQGPASPPPTENPPHSATSVSVTPRDQGRRAGLMAAGMLLTSSPNLQTAAIITPHNAYTLTALATLASLALYLQTRAARWGYATMVTLALSFLAFEYAPLLLATVLVCVWLDRRRLRETASRVRQVRVLAGAAACGGFILLAAWPAGLLKLGLFKNYAFFAYYALFRSETYGTQSPWEVWLGRATHMPVTFGLLLLSAVIYWRMARSQNGSSRLPPSDVAGDDQSHRELNVPAAEPSCQAAGGMVLLPFAVYGLLHFAVTWRVASPLPTYVSALWPPLYVLSGLILVRGMSDYRMPQWSQAALLFVIAVALSIQTHGTFIVPAREQTDTPMRNAVRLLQTSVDTRQILVAQGFVPTLHYYLPDRRFPVFREREVVWRELAEQAQREHCRGVMYSGGDHESLAAELSRHFAISRHFLGRRAVFYALAAKPN